MKKKIVDNHSSKKLLDSMAGMNQLIVFQKYLPTKFQLLPQINQYADKLKALQSDAQELLQLPDKFNQIFSEHGWIASESMSVQAMKEAIVCNEKYGIENAEIYLADYFHDKQTLDFLFMRIQWYPVFDKRMRLLNLAREDYEACRYHACIPLLLALVDGIVNDLSKHVGIFAENSDLTAWDSIVGHESGLQYIAKIFKQTRKRTNEEPINIPYRNGILHGRDLAFDNEIVASKCWAILFWIRDWIDGVKKARNLPIDESENKDLSVVLQEILRNEEKQQQFNKWVEEWKPRDANKIYMLPISPDDDGSIFEANTPEATVANFMNDWMHKRYGKLVPILYGSSVEVKKKVGQVKKDYENINLNKFSITNIVDEAPAISIVYAEIIYKINEHEYIKNITIRAVYEDDNQMPLFRNDTSGSWKIIQASFSHLLFGEHRVFT